MMTQLGLNIVDTFNKELPADQDLNNTRRQVLEACYSFVEPIQTSDAKLIAHSPEVARILGISEHDVQSSLFTKVFSGNEVLEGTAPFAMCYGGHQFGHWAGQLGDGRAINLTEVLHNDKRWALQLKGAGPTPYSRRADGLAVLRSSIREFLLSEAMHHLGVPGTRALSLALTGDQVMRDMMYDGNGAYEKGAVVCRVAQSFIRFGNFEIFASRNDKVNLAKLMDYTIKHFYPHIGKPSKESYLQFFQEVCDRTMKMIIHWQRVGFVHGVMNTDNFSILGLTIDYGPYGWLEPYDQGWTPNTTDNTNKRYRYGYQMNISLWNLAQLANALFLVIEDAKSLETILMQYRSDIQKAYFGMMKSKIGLIIDEDGDESLVVELEELLQKSETDMTIFFRLLANASKEDSLPVEGDKQFLSVIEKAFYKPEEIKDDVLDSWRLWWMKYLMRLKKESIDEAERKSAMNLVNPKYVLRNYMAQLAIDDADKGDYSLINSLLEVLRNPYDEKPEHEKWFVKRPEWARNKIGCSMLSCSS